MDKMRPGGPSAQFCPFAWYESEGRVRRDPFLDRFQTVVGVSLYPLLDFGRASPIC